MSPYVRKLSKETGKSVSDIEKLWDKAKVIASEEFGKSPDAFGNREYSFTVGIVKNMLGVKEELLDPQTFLNSDLSALDFLKEVTVSGQFDIGNVVPPEDEDEDEEEEEKTEAQKDGKGRDGTGPHGQGAGPGRGQGCEDEEEDDEKKKQLLQDLDDAAQIEVEANDLSEIKATQSQTEKALSEEEQIAVIDQVLKSS